MNYLNTAEIQHLLLELLDKCDRTFSSHGLRYTLDGGTLLGAVRHKGFIPWDDDVDLLMPRPDFDRLCEHPEWAPDGCRICIPGKDGYELPFIKVMDLDWRAQEDSLLGAVDEYLWVDVFPADPIPNDPSKAAILFQSQEKTCRRAARSYNNSAVTVANSSSVARMVKLAILPLYRVLFPAKRWFAKLGEKAKEIPYDSARIVGDVVWAPYKDDKPGFPVEDFDELIGMGFEGRIFKACAHWDEYLTGLYGDYMQLPPENQRVTHGTKVWKVEK